MGRAVILECDKCGKTCRGSDNRISLWRKKIKWEKYDICALYGEDESIYLCGDCAKALRVWLGRKFDA